MPGTRYEVNVGGAAMRDKPGLFGGDLGNSILSAVHAVLSGDARQHWIQGEPALIERAHAIYAEESARAVDKPSRNWLTLATLILVIHERLKEVITDPAQERATLVEALKLPFRGRMLQVIKDRWELDPSKPDDAIGKIRLNFTKKARARFGETFQYSEKVSDESIHEVWVTKCFFNDFFRERGVPELTSVFCVWDSIWSDALNASNYNASFERPETLADGADHCSFRFRTRAGRSS